MSASTSVTSLRSTRPGQASSSGRHSTGFAVLDAVDGRGWRATATATSCFLAGARDAARRVHLCVHAQLAAFCVSMKAVGAPLAEIRRHAVRTCSIYQLPAEDLRVLLREYDEPAGGGGRSRNSRRPRRLHHASAFVT